MDVDATTATNSRRLRIKMMKEMKAFDIGETMPVFDDVGKYCISDMMSFQTRKKILSECPNSLIGIKIKTKKKKQVNSTGFDMSRVKSREAKRPTLHMWASWLLIQPWYSKIIIPLIIIDVIDLIAEGEITNYSNEVPEGYEVQMTIITVAKYTCCFFFILEILLHWIQDFKQFWKSFVNILDFVVTIIPNLIYIIELLTHTNLYSSYFQITRVFRLLKAVWNMNEMKMIMRTVAKAMKTMTYVFLLLAVFGWAYAMFGEILFQKYTHYDAEKEGLDLPNQQLFSSAEWSLATLFKYLTLDRWEQNLQEIMLVQSSPFEKFLACLYMSTWIVIGSFISVNLFTGIMVNNFLDIRSDIHDQEGKKLMKHEVTTLQEEIENEFAGVTTDVDDKNLFSSYLDQRQNFPTVDTVHAEASQSIQNTQNMTLSRNTSISTHSHHIPLNPSHHTNSSHHNNSSLHTNLHSRLTKLHQHEHKEERLNSAWKNVIQRHFDLREKDGPEVIWLEGLLYEYYSAMIQLQDNLMEQDKILRLLNLNILQMCE